MATIGSILVLVKASTSGLRKSLKKAEKNLKSFAKNASKTLKGIGKSLTVGVTAGIAAITLLVGKYAKKIDDMAKFSTKFGLTVAQLQKLQYQAELTGVSFSTMNMSLQKMVRNVSEAGKGIGTAKEELKELGLSADALNKLSPDKQFLAIAEAMKQVGNQNDKVRIAIAIFGRSGTDVLNTMAGDLSGMSKEFDSLGIAITQQQAKMVESFNDSKTELSTIFSGFGIQLTAQLAGPLKTLIKWISKTVKEMGGVGEAAKSFARFVITGIKSSISAVQLLVKAFTKVENLMLRIENIKLLPAVAAEATASFVAGTPGLVGNNTQKSFDNTDQINSNNAALKNNEYINKLDKLLVSIDQSVGKNVELADSAGKVTASNLMMAESAVKASELLKSVSSNDSIYADEYASGGVGSIQDYINGSTIDKTVQKIYGRDPASRALESSKPTTRITLEMVTDAGKVAGELVGNQSFIDAISKLQVANTNNEARLAAQ